MSAGENQSFFKAVWYIAMRFNAISLTSEHVYEYFTDEENDWFFTGGRWPRVASHSSGLWYSQNPSSLVNIFCLIVWL